VDRSWGRESSRAENQSGGFIGATEVGLLLGILYLVNKRNIWVNIVCHGVFDSISLIAIYYSRPG
ncbi:MAG: type II CAAX prenyl endopeptidase Rce1 family protein, partial [Candidatus Kryptoniota bacterium]